MIVTIEEDAAVETLVTAGTIAEADRVALTMVAAIVRTTYNWKTITRNKATAYGLRQ